MSHETMPLFRDRLAWDTGNGAITDGPARYVLIRADALMGLFRALPGPARQAALDAFKRSVTEHGGRSAQRYQDARQDSDPDVLTLVAAGAAQLGWGRWIVERHDNLLRVIVENSPFASGHGPADHAVCGPISGILEAAAAIALGQKFIATELRCAAAGAGSCLFELAPAPAPGRND